MACGFGYAYQFQRFSTRSYSQFCFEWGYSESFAQNLGLLYVVSLCLAIATAPFKKFHGCLFLALISLLLEIFCLSCDHGSFMPWLVWPSHALRLAPFAILAFSLSPKNTFLVLRVATALTFLGHGIKSLCAYPVFIDYILVFLQKLGFQPSENLGRTVLISIGTIDIALAHHLLFFNLQRVRWVLIYMMVWGAITALARMVYAGWGGWHEVVIRAPHFLLPYVLYRWVYLCVHPKRALIEEMLEGKTTTSTDFRPGSPETDPSHRAEKPD